MDRLVDVYLDGRLLATCPIALCEAPEGVLIAKARQMLRDDDVMSGESLSRARFCIRRSAAAVQV